jgi:response regulator RpfG family c-di-GMP phosphodiesterase
MYRQKTVNLGNLVLSLSDAMDLASPLLMQHQLRTAFVVWKMGMAAKLVNDRIEKSFMAALLHDIGALSPEEKIDVHSFDVGNTEVHCIRGEKLLNNINCLKDSAKLVRFHHREWLQWNNSIEDPLVFDSQLLSLSDYLERLIRRDQYILHQNEYIISEIRSKAGSFFHPLIVDLFMEISNSEEFWLDIMSTHLFSLLRNEGPFKKSR